MWDAKRILKELADDARRKEIFTAFWKSADDQTKALAIVSLSRALHFRDETIRKMPLEKKAELLASRAGAREFQEMMEAALMHYHTHEATEMMGAFLDLWTIPHQNGSIETDDYKPPVEGQVRDAVRQLEGYYDRKDIALYLASVGLLMGEAWRKATWPVVDEIVPTSSRA
jgi:hypothetical protein